jgi:hypothetical protein
MRDTYFWAFCLNVKLIQPLYMLYFHGKKVSCEAVAIVVKKGSHEGF